MAQFASVILASILLANIGAAHASQKEIVFQLNDNYGTWTSDASPKKEGTQNYLYSSLSFLSKKYGVRFLTAMADTQFNNNDTTRNDFSLSRVLDSTISTFYKFDNLSGLDIRAGLDLSWPTGNATFTNSDLNSLLLDNVSKDLNMVTSFGKGLDLTPNVVIAKNIGNSVIGIGLSYKLTGKYDPTKEVDNDQYDPGNTIKLVATWQVSTPRFPLIFFDISRTTSTRDKQGGAEVFRQGDMTELSMRLVKKYSQLRTTYGITYAMQESSEALGTIGLITEDRNSNNNRFEGFVNLSYQKSEKVTLNAIFGHKSVYENSYTPGEILYDGGYNKNYGGGGISYQLSDNTFFTFDLRFFKLKNQPDALENELAHYTGYNLDFGFVYKVPSNK